MGREVRRVPAKWQHPRRHDGSYDPMVQQTYVDAIAEWFKNHSLWLEGKHPIQLGEEPNYGNDPSKSRFWAEYEDEPPTLNDGYNTHYTPEEATWYQLYETVSEGTPVTPPFATQEELAEYLALYGDFWSQRQGAKPPTIEQARSLVMGGWAPSGVVVTGGQVLDPYQQQDLNEVPS